MWFRSSMVMVVVLGAGCAAAPDGDEPIPVTAVLSSAIGDDCDEFMCGTNSPEIAEFGFWDLHLPASLAIPGDHNNVGLQLRRFVKANQSFVPSVEYGRLIARNGLIELTGTQLIGGALVVTRGTRLFRVHIVDVGTVASWAQHPGPSLLVTLESYQLEWAELIDGGFGHYRNVCRNPPDRDSPDLGTMIGNTRFHTLLFEGDRIDAAGKRVTGVDNRWFNLGCAGSALAKLALTGHTQASANATTFTTTLLERQAMLKLLTADYCGDGTPFTVGGQPLNWRDAQGTMKLAALQTNPPSPLVLEARWDAAGPACLNQPRVDVHWTQLGEDTFGNDLTVYDQAKAHCPGAFPPPCSNLGFATRGYHVLSATVPFEEP